LNRQEFADFIHPEQSQRMKDLVVTETIEDIDRNQDGLISIEEYIADMWDTDTDANRTVEPEWIRNERDNFRVYRDLDHDGKLNRHEVQQWLMPTDYDNIQAETAHLFNEADENRVNTIHMFILLSVISNSFSFIVLGQSIDSK
jgi:calumenin